MMSVSTSQRALPTGGPVTAASSSRIVVRDASIPQDPSRHGRHYVVPRATQAGMRQVSYGSPPLDLWRRVVLFGYIRHIVVSCSGRLLFLCLRLERVTKASCDRIYTVTPDNAIRKVHDLLRTRS